MNREKELVSEFVLHLLKAQDEFQNSHPGELSVPLSMAVYAEFYVFCAIAASNTLPEVWQRVNIRDAGVNLIKQRLENAE